MSRAKNTIGIAKDIIRKEAAAVAALEQDGGVRLRRVAVLFAHDAFELAEADSLFVCELGLLVQLLALVHGLPQALVAHDDGVDNAELVELELLLAVFGRDRLEAAGAALAKSGAATK